MNRSRRNLGFADMTLKPVESTSILRAQGPVNIGISTRQIIPQKCNFKFIPFWEIWEKPLKHHMPQADSKKYQGNL